jgi:hypothetical protein
MDFTIGRHRDGGHWEELETVTAKDPAAAFSQWVDAQGGTEAGQYGVRANDGDAWNGSSAPTARDSIVWTYSERLGDVA